MKHSKVTIYEDMEDGSIKAVTSSYFEELASRREDIIKNIKTNHNDYMADVMSCLDVVKNPITKELHIIISLDEWNKPSLITKQYTVRKENFKRR